MLEFQWFVKYTIHRNQCLSHCRILSVFFTPQDTHMSLLHSPLGSGAVCSNSIQCSFFPQPNDVDHPNTHRKRGRAPEYSCTHRKRAGKFKVLEYGKRGKLLSSRALSSQRQFTSPLLEAPSGKHRIALSPQSHQCGPILGAKVCHQLLLLVVFTPTQSTARACRFCLQGVTAVVHGC